MEISSASAAAVCRNLNAREQYEPSGPKNPGRCGAVEFCLFHGTSNVLWDEVRAQGPG